MYPMEARKKNFQKLFSDVITPQNSGRFVRQFFLHFFLKKASFVI